MLYQQQQQQYNNINGWKNKGTHVAVAIVATELMS